MSVAIGVIHMAQKYDAIARCQLGSTVSKTQSRCVRLASLASEKVGTRDAWAPLVGNGHEIPPGFLEVLRPIVWSPLL